MANVVRELSAKAVFSIDGFLGKMNSLEKSLDNLPAVTEKATGRMNDSFGDVSKSLTNFDELLKKSGKDFDTKAVQSELQKAQKELAETGNVTKETMSSLNKEINNVDWKSLDVKSRTEFKKVIQGVGTVEKSMNRLNDVKFLESLPEDARLAGAKLLDLEKDASKAQRALEKVGADTDLSVLNKGLADARQELQETGKVSENTMKGISKSVSSVDVDALPNKFKGAFDKVGQQADSLKSTLSDIGKGGTSDIADDMGDIATNAGKAEGATGLLGGALESIKGGGYVAVIGGIAAGITAIGKGALESKDAINELSVQTGATGKELEGLKKVMYDIYSNNFGENMGDIADVLSTVKTATNLTGKELQKATENAILMRDSFEWEPEQTMNAVRAMMKNFNLTQEEAFNLLTQGRQQMGKGADDLLDTFKEYGSAFHEIGLSGEDSMNMMNNAMDAGIINTDKAADAINEMSILMREMPETSSDAMKSLDLNAKEVQSAFAQGGDKARDMFFKVTGALRDMKDPVKQNAAGIAIFGTMWEDAGAEALLALGKTDGKIKQSKDALKSLNNVKYDNIGSALQGVGRQIVGNVLIPIQDKLMPGINNAIKKVSQFAALIKGAFDRIKNLPQTDVLKKIGFSNGQANNIINWFNNLKKQLSIAGGAVKGFFQLFKGNGTQGVITLSKLGLKPETIQQISGFADKIKKTFSQAFGAVASFAKKGMGEVMKFFAGPDGKQLMQAVRNIGNVISTVMKAIWAVMKFVWPAVKALIKSVWDNIKGVISGGLRVIKGLIQVFSGIFTGDFRKMWEGIKNIFSGAIKLIWNGVQLLFYGKLLKGGLAFAKLFAGGLKSMWGNIFKFFKSFGSNIVSGTTGAFRSLNSGVSKVFSGTAKWLRDAASSLAKSVIGFFRNLWTNSVKMVTSLKDGLVRIWSSIRTSAYNAGKYVRDKVVDFFRLLWTGVSGKMGEMYKGLANRWKSIKDSAYNAGKFVKDKVTGAFADTWTGVKSWIGKIKNGVIGMKNDVVQAGKDLASGLAKYAIGGLNRMIDGVNWVAEKIGMDKPLNHISPSKYSTGTGATKEAEMAIVGDRGPGNGPNGFRNELIRYPNGHIELSPDKDTLRYLPAGTTVFNGEQTYGILSQMNDTEPGAGGPIDWIKDKVKSGLSNALFKTIGTASKVFGAKKTGQALSYAADKGAAIKKTAFDVWDYASNPGKLMNLALDKFGVNFDGIKGVPGDIMGALFGKLKTGISSKFKSWFDSSGGASGATAGILDPRLINYFFGHTEAYTRETGRWWHEGVDFPFVYQNLKTPMGGTLTRQPFMAGGYGNWVTVDNGLTRLIFGHLRDYGRSPASGTRVKPGDTVGISGNSGFSTGPHLHFGVKQNGQDINPLPWLRNAKPRKRSKGTVGSHRIKWGDTLSGIAMKYGTTVAALKKLNRLRSDMIYAGRTLKVPTKISVGRKSSSRSIPRSTTRIGQLSGIASNLSNRAKTTKYSTLANSYTGISQMITKATRTAKTDSPETLYKNMQAVVKKIDSTILANQKKITANNAKARKSKGNKKVIADVRAENKAIQSQIDYLKSVKKNEMLKGDVLKKLVQRRADLSAALAKAQEQNKALKEEKASFRGSLSESMMGYAGFGAAKGNTSRDFVAFMNYRLGQVRKFGANVRKLVGMGISRSILKDILAEGMESAMPKVAMLVGGGKKYISQINGLQSQIQKEVSGLSLTEAGYVYNKQVVASNRSVKAKREALNVVDKKKVSYVTAKKPIVKKAVKKPVKKAVVKKPSKAAKVTSYLIKWGDTLGAIAQKFHTSVANLKKMNGLKSDMIYAGKKLKVPGYATGGIVNIPQLAWIAEGGFAESIISHDPARRTSQERIWQQTGEQLGFSGSMSSQDISRMIAVLEDIRRSNDEIAKKRAVIEMNAKVVGQEVAPHTDRTIAESSRLAGRGLANR